MIVTKATDVCKFAKVRIRSMKATVWTYHARPKLRDLFKEATCLLADDGALLMRSGTGNCRPHFQNPIHLPPQLITLRENHPTIRGPFSIATTALCWPNGCLGLVAKRVKPHKRTSPPPLSASADTEKAQPPQNCSCPGTNRFYTRESHNHLSHHKMHNSYSFDTHTYAEV